MRKLVAKQVFRNLTTRKIDQVWISTFNSSGREVKTELMSGYFFPDDLEDGDEVCFIQARKFKQVAGLAKLGESIIEGI